ncbi:MAG: RsmD family RNA methyltransferase [Roseiflexaceae bacterium]|nr:RsmD family RNA methyltransferase [Roseiflexaceae bacterium]
MTHDSETPPDDILSFDATTFDAELRELLVAPNVATLREGVAALQAGWLAADRPDANGAGISFPFSFIAEELAQIGAALTIERARYYVERLRRSGGQPRTNGVNDLDLNRWKTYADIQTDSLWQIERRDKVGAHTAGYWGNFVPQIPNQMMRRYTKKGDWVLDAFAGSGTTLIEAQRLGRNCLGVELQEDVAASARARVESEPNQHGTIGQIVTGDSSGVDFRALLGQHGQQQAQLVLLHPPYHDIIKFSSDPRDLSNCGTVERFLEQLGEVSEQAAQALAPGGHLVLVIGDKYARGEWLPLGFQAMQALQRPGLTLKSIVVKNFEETTGKRTQKELWRYRALAGGFFVFKHEYIFVFEATG